MSLKLLTLNIEGDKHLDLFIPFLQQEQADVVCLQEVFEVDMHQLNEALGITGTFAATSSIEAENRYGVAPKGAWGIAYFTRLKQTDIQAIFYKKEAPGVPVFVDGQPNSADRALLISRVQKSDQEYCIGTTHFTWSGDGNITDDQVRDFDSMIKVLEPYQDLVLCGDFNVPRGREMFDTFTKYFTDNLPPECTTTIDKNIHYAGDLQVAVDNIFTRGKYSVSDVRVVNGVSDHMAVIGTINNL